MITQNYKIICITTGFLYNIIENNMIVSNIKFFAENSN